MKIIALGDTHGRENWKAITRKNDFDKVIFIGDYFDSHEGVSPKQQKENFKDIIAFKKANPNKVILLIGNHDFQYLKTSNETYSQFQPLHKADIQGLLHKAIDENLMQMCYAYKDILFTHAGVTKTWCKANNVDLSNIQQSINDLFKNKPNAFRFTSGKNGNRNGDDITQSPIWVRPKSLYMDKIPNYTWQACGHTTMDTIAGLNGSRKFYTDGMMFETSGVIFIDTLGTSGQYLQIVDDKISAVNSH